MAQNKLKSKNSYIGLGKDKEEIEIGNAKRQLHL